MLRKLAFWRDLVAFISDWPRWRQARHAPRPSLAKLRLEYERARKAHRGQQAAYERLRTAWHIELKRELGL